MLWVDLTQSEREPALPYGIEECCTVEIVRDPAQLRPMIDLRAPKLLCFEFDYPSDAGLAVLTQTKRDYPAIPILMITVYHSEALILWALRARVWDYYVKPYSAEDLLRSALSLFRVSQQHDRSSGGREVILPLHDFAYMRNLKGNEKIILKAQSYILKNLAEPIQLKHVAEYCCVSRTYLSRLFKQVSGTTFKEFVLATRIRRAIELLGNLDAAVTNICYDVGFRDVSHFGRVFRRYVGMSPTAYRRQVFNNRRIATEWRPLPALAGADVDV
jgi:YesN/AraC family two-component response regulator